MARAHTRLCWLGIAAFVAACGGSPPPAAPPKPTAAAPAASKPAAAPAAPAAAAKPAQPTAALVPAPAVPSEPPAPKFDMKGRRDPFETLEVREGASGPNIASAKLTGIVRGGPTPLALIETADGIGYIVKPGDTLGDGRLQEIGGDSVTFSVVPRPGSTTTRVVLKLPSD